MFERTGERANLAMQKRTRARQDVNFVALPHDIEPFQGAHRAFRLALRGTKRRKIMAAEENARRRCIALALSLRLTSQTWPRSTVKGARRLMIL